MMADKIDEDALRFGQMLQSYREGAKVTQQDIADATGLTKNYISSMVRLQSSIIRLLKFEESKPLFQVG